MLRARFRGVPPPRRLSRRPRGDMSEGPNARFLAAARNDSLFYSVTSGGESVLELRKVALQVVNYMFGFGHAAVAYKAAGQFAAFNGYKYVAIGVQQFDVAFYAFVFPHI